MHETLSLKLTCTLVPNDTLKRITPKALPAMSRSFFQPGSGLLAASRIFQPDLKVMPTSQKR